MHPSHPWQPKLIEIMEYQPAWPKLFQKEKEVLEKVLGSDALAIHHIGSTSVLTLAAKPIIDMLLVLPRLSLPSQLHQPNKPSQEENFLMIIAPLEPLGYEHLGNIILPQSHFFIKKKGAYPIHLHTYLDGDPQIKRHLFFRNWLRNHSADRKGYETLKKRLAHECGTDRAKYNEAKTSWIKKIDAKAQLMKLN